MTYGEWILIGAFTYTNISKYDLGNSKHVNIYILYYSKKGSEAKYKDI